MNINFDISKIKYILNMHGQMYEFKRKSTDDFAEETDDEPISVTTVKGLFHQVRGHIDKQTSDGTIRRSKPQPALLVLINEDTQKILLQDFVVINETTYTVTGINNINNMGIAFDISMEMVDNGT